MTFTLKDYDELKKHFNDTVTILLERDVKETIEQLELGRRNQIKFLRYVIESIDTAIKKPYPRSALPEAATTLYGAMSLISTIITASLGHIHRNSLLRDRLNLGMGIDEDNQPSNLQYKEFYRKLNQFLKLIFVSKDSLQGIKLKHGLQYVPLDNLVSFMKKSYEQEEFYQKKSLEEYTMDGLPTVEPKVSKTDKLSTDILAPFKNWKHLQESLNTLILQELASKNAAHINLLSKERSIQLNFLQSLAESVALIPLTDNKENEKIAILAGAMHIVREQIGQEYGKLPLNPGEIAGSIIHKGLTKILIAKPNYPEHTEALVQKANAYILYMTTEQQKFRTTHPFSTIKDFNLITLLELNYKIIKSCRTAALDTAVLEHHQQLNLEDDDKVEWIQKTSITDYLGSYFKSFKPSTTKLKKTTDVIPVFTIKGAEENALSETNNSLG